jgi:hypothetical protein
MSSDVTYQVVISFNQRLEGLNLELVNGLFETVFSGASETINISLSPGVYQLKARFIDYYQEYVLFVDSIKTIRLDLDYPSVAPILSFKTTHEYLSDTAHQYSQSATTTNNGGKPDFFFFGAKYDKDQSVEGTPNIYLQRYSILDKNGEPIFPFNADNTKCDNQFGWFSFSNCFGEGMYFLKWEKDSEARIFPFYIYKNYQTQFFIRYGASPDFENAFFFYSDRMEFNRDAEEYLVLDKIMFAYKDYSNYKSITEKDRAIIRQHPFLVALVQILQKVLNTTDDFAACNSLPLPDIRLVNSSHSSMYIDIEDELPVLSALMSKFAAGKKLDKIDFMPASLIDRTVDHVRFDLFWNNFSKIDEPKDWVEKYSRFVKKSRLLSINSGDNSFMKAGKKLLNIVGSASASTIQGRLDSLLGKADTQNVENKINDAINSIGNISEISNKLNVPPTTVLRNYQAYKDIYDKLK